MAADRILKLKLQICCGTEIAMGPGKADLLDAISRAGSISAAARAMEMSYRRAWLLVDTMNRCWAQPVVATVPGGSHGRGARVTPFGAGILARYRALQTALTDQAAAYQAELAAALRATPRPQSDPPILPDDNGPRPV